MHTLALAATHVGQRRQHNEDRYCVNDELGLYAVADGMGGHAKGEVAAQLSVDTVESHLRDRVDELRRAREAADGNALVELVRGATHAACAAVFHAARERPTQSGMGCTLSVLVVADSTAVLGHIGDSRVYLLRDGHVEQLSQDHTYAAEMLRGGRVDPSDPILQRYKHVLSRAVGQQEVVQVDLLQFAVLPGDRLLLCSDGLSEYVPSDDWLATALGDADFDGVPDALVAMANNAGGKDNITAVAVQVTVDPAHHAAMLQLRTDFHVKIDALNSVWLFENLSFTQMNRVLEICEAVVYAVGQEVTIEGDPIGHLILVLEGELELRRGGRRVANIAGGEHVGATSLARPRRARGTLVALKRTHALVLRREDFGALCQARPWLGIALLQRLALRLGDTLDRAVVDDANAGEPLTGSIV